MPRFIPLLLLLLFLAACGGGSQRVTLPAGVATEVSVLVLDADTTGLSDDQVALLNQTLGWMERDLITQLKRKGFAPLRIAAAKDFTGKGHLLKVQVTDHKLIPKGARVWTGMMAGADRLNVHYELSDGRGQTLLAWDDTQASTKSGTHCAQTLNRNATEKVAAQLSQR